MTEQPRLLPDEPVASLDAHLAAGGGAGIAAAERAEADEVIDELERAGLRGRGGAGFPTATKWRGVVDTARAQDSALAIVANAAEGEPGTYKDRLLLERQPYAFLEGLCVALVATGARRAHVGIKEKFTRPVERLTAALEEVVAAGWSGADRIDVVTGPDEYLFGEETAMLEVIEGKLPMPRLVKPFEVGLHATTTEPNPTIVNNVETLSHVGRIVAHGADWFRQAGTQASPGTMAFTVVGDVDRPGVYELPLGTPLRTLLDIAEAREPKAIYSGVSAQVITPEHLDVALGFDEMQEVGLGMGSGGFIVYDQTRSMIDVLAVLVNFLAVESCGQCNACKLGSTAMADILAAAQRGEATNADLERMMRRNQTVTDLNRCFLPVGEQLLVGSTVQAFADELASTVERGQPTPADLPTPLVESIDEDAGEVTYHPRYHLKRYDWSFDDVDPRAERLEEIRDR